MATILFLISALAAIALGSPVPEDENRQISFTTSTTSLEGLVNHHRNLSCDSLAPSHSNAAPQNTPAPYNITLERFPLSTEKFNNSIPLSASISLTVHGGEFRGLYIQARNSQGVPDGSFIPTDDPHVIFYDCGNNTNSFNNAVAYISHDPIDSYSFTWNAQEPTTVRFHVTIVESYSKFWVGVTTDPVTVVDDRL